MPENTPFWMANATRRPRGVDLTPQRYAWSPTRCPKIAWRRAGMQLTTRRHCPRSCGCPVGASRGMGLCLVPPSTETLQEVSCMTDSARRPRLYWRVSQNRSGRYRFLARRRPLAAGSWERDSQGPNFSTSDM